MFQYRDRLSSRMPGEGLPSVSVGQVLVGLLNQFINNFVFLFPHEPLRLGFNNENNNNNVLFLLCKHSYTRLNLRIILTVTD